MPVGATNCLKPSVTIVAYDRPRLKVSSNRSTSVSTHVSSAVHTVPADPAYIEVRNYVRNADLQLINVSKKPDSTFAQDAVSLAIDHVIPESDGTLTAIAHLDPREMKDSTMAPGDLVKLRQVDQAGNGSLPTGLILVDPDLNKLPVAEEVPDVLHTDTFGVGSRKDVSRNRTLVGSTNRSRTYRTTTTRTTTTTRQTDKVRFTAHTVRFAVRTRNGMLPAKSLDDMRYAAKTIYRTARDTPQHTGTLEHYRAEFAAGMDQYASQAIDRSGPNIVEERLTVESRGAGFVLKADRALEPQTVLTVVNLRTQTKTSVRVDDVSAELALPEGSLIDDDLAILLSQDEQRAHTRNTSSRFYARLGDNGLLGLDDDARDNARYFYKQLSQDLGLPE